ncbi:MAG: hypothetical protein NE334_02895 [Lentisphaeraceae bacterium]|nr:hypothetical protein [Lentisphaeraceae bacterium]
MKYLLTLLLTFSSVLFAQEDSMRTFANADYKVKAYLVPDVNHEFVAKTGTRVRITVELINNGKSRFILKQSNFITAALLVKAREIDFPLHIEKYTQEQMLKARETTISNRIKNVTEMKDDEAIRYAKLLYPEDKLTNKAGLLQKLEGMKKAIQGMKKAVTSFDKSKVVEPGSNFVFTATGTLPAGNDKPEDYCDLSIRIVNSDNKHISIPVQGIFY